MQDSKKGWLIGGGLVAYAIITFAFVVYFVALLQPSSSSFNHLAFDDELSSKTLLPDFKNIKITKVRKQEFLGLLRPLVDEKNEKLLKSRERLLKMKQEFDATGELTGVNARNLSVMRTKYQISEKTYPETGRALEILLLRVDAIPPAMVLAQAAAESGWGTSRFAEEAHNLFGQWCYQAGCGIVPARRAASAKHEVRKFNSVEESITAYYRNINTHNAYRAWRQARAQVRDKPEYFTGVNMVATLGKYSERGDAYIHELRKLITSNRLE